MDWLIAIILVVGFAGVIGNQNVTSGKLSAIEQLLRENRENSDR